MEDSNQDIIMSNNDLTETQNNGIETWLGIGDLYFQTMMKHFPDYSKDGDDTERNQIEERIRNEFAKRVKVEIFNQDDGLRNTIRKNLLYMDRVADRRNKQKNCDNDEGGGNNGGSNRNHRNGDEHNNEKNANESTRIQSRRRQSRQLDPGHSQTYIDIFNGARNEGEEFSNLYTIKKLLGEGAFSKVKEIERNDDHQLFAVKIVSKAEMCHADEIALKDEISILRTLDHPNILKLYDAFHEPKYYYLVTELMRGGELFDRIMMKQSYNEKEARDVCKILFEAVTFFHQHSIAHRDLKPDNLLLMSRSDDRDIKIADFGFAKKVTSEHCLVTQCGTPSYVAPEILLGQSYGTKADMWSLGVITFIILGGYFPFHAGTNQKVLFKLIKKGVYKFHDEHWGGTSKEAKDLISSLLTVDPNERITASDARKSAWVLGNDSDLECFDVNIKKFKKYNARRKLRQGVLSLIASNKMTSLGYQFRSNLLD